MKQLIWPLSVIIVAALAVIAVVRSSQQQQRIEDLESQVTAIRTGLKSAAAQVDRVVKATAAVEQSLTPVLASLQEPPVKYGEPAPTKGRLIQEVNSLVAELGSRSAPSPLPNEPLRLIRVESRVTESNGSYHQYSWRLIVRNDSPRQVTFDANIKFEDQDGFIVDDDDAYKLVVGPFSEQSYNGYELIDASVVGRIFKTTAVISPRL
jgi:type II secretory pathway pseudopilin PulG